MGTSISRVKLVSGTGLVFVMLTYFFILCAGPLFVSSIEAQASTADSIYKAIAGGVSYESGLTSATFKKDGVTWTIVGATAEIVNPTPIVTTWPVQGNNYEIYVVSKPITNTGVLPYTESLANASRTDVISVQGCPDEYEAASFVIRSGDSDIKNVRLLMTDLKQTAIESQTISSSNIDVRTVKCWFQGGDVLWDVKNKMLKPELLLHDDSIVQINSQYQVNLIRNLEQLTDSDSLMSFDVPARSNKQLWMTIKIPANTMAGEYTGTFILSADGMSNRLLQMKVTVLPINLARPKMVSSIFYLTGAYDGSIGTQFKRNLQSRLIEFKDMKAHGIDNPLIEQRTFNETDLHNLLQLKYQAGMDTNTLFYTAWPKLPTTEEKKIALLKSASQVLSYARQKGIADVYFYGFDEIRGTDLDAARPILESLKSMGLRIMQTAMSIDTVDVLGDLLDVIIYHGGALFPKTDPAPSTVISLAHQKGEQIWIYGYPQGGLEQPETYRRNYGILLWKNNIDGLCTYSYQTPMREPWDDWDQRNPDYRDELMVYPTVNGIIPTIHWEGYREAVDDLRYLTTLENMISAVPSSNVRTEALTWLKNLDPNQDLYNMRQQAINYILALQGTKSADAPSPPKNLQID